MSEEIRLLILDIFVVNRGNTDYIQRMEVNAIQMSLNFEIEVVDEHSAEYDIIHDYARRSSGKLKIISIFRIDNGFSALKLEDNVFLMYHGTPDDIAAKIVATDFRIPPKTGNSFNLNFSKLGISLIFFDIF
jgi:hypothetical protein